MSTETASSEPVVAAKGKTAKANTNTVVKEKQPRAKTSRSSIIGKVTINKSGSKVKAGEIPDGLSKQYYGKSTFNTSDIMHSPVEKTLQILDKILAGEKLFTM